MNACCGWGSAADLMEWWQYLAILVVALIGMAASRRNPDPMLMLMLLLFAAFGFVGLVAEAVRW